MTTKEFLNDVNIIGDFGVTGQVNANAKKRLLLLIDFRSFHLLTSCGACPDS